MFSLLIVLVLLLSGVGMTYAAEDTFSSLKHRLIEDGFSTQQITKVFQPQPAVMFKTVAQTLRIRESRLNYDQFLEPAVIDQGLKFLRNHESILAHAEKTYGVDRRVIVALLLVETRFGSYTGRTPTLAILSSFALLERKSNRNKVWALLPAQDRERWNREAFDQKLIARSEWAYQELCSLLRLADSSHIQVKSIQGSVMGAVGWPQFLPSSLLRYGADGNNDGRIDLFQAADAIFSIANYLRGYGWCEAKDRAAREQVIYQYNHSRPYIETVLSIAARLN
ncbi:MAG: lytic murein transglycosylase [Syntrophobacteraceae bacterium]